MANFNINGSSAVAQNLALNEVGFIGTAGNLLSLSAAAVTMQA